MVSRSTSSYCCSKIWIIGIYPTNQGNVTEATYPRYLTRIIWVDCGREAIICSTFRIFTICAHAYCRFHRRSATKGLSISPQHSASYLVTRSVMLTSGETGTYLLIVHEKLFKLCSGWDSAKPQTILHFYMESYIVFRTCGQLLKAETASKGFCRLCKLNRKQESLAML